MFLHLTLLLEDWIKHVYIGLFDVKFAFPQAYFRAVFQALQLIVLAVFDTMNEPFACMLVQFFEI